MPEGYCRQDIPEQPYGGLNANMQPINENRIQNQVIAPRQKVSIQAETFHKTTSRQDTFILPMDIVNLSALPTDSLARKAPSSPVTAAEKNALRDSFSVYA